MLLIITKELNVFIKYMHCIYVYTRMYYTQCINRNQTKAQANKATDV